MTDKLKCPFCNAELRLVSDNIAMCQNIQCDMWHKPAYKDLWELAIDGQKAQKALVVAREVLERNNFTDIVKYIDIITEPKEE